MNNETETRDGEDALLLIEKNEKQQSPRENNYYKNDSTMRIRRGETLIVT